jgi:hypothetical protein
VQIHRLSTYGGFMVLEKYFFWMIHSISDFEYLENYSVI